ncbi:MAG: thymidylate synthase [Candidatus Gracilibacteria bacterium]|nr:thymidylate synthase [Candidatus Gracilibacteria bacterium]
MKETRNSKTLSLFGEVLEINCLEEGLFPLLTTRRIYTRGVIGEFAAFLRSPKHLKDFEKYGCNYWKLWAKDDGSINVDYGNKWLDFGGVNQLKELIETLKTNPNDRRMIISAWDPSNLKNLDLPCCHYAYQFYVRNGKLDLLWHQRSADFMVGVPSDIVLAALMVITIAKETNLALGTIKMVFGDTHIYESHIKKAKKQLNNYMFGSPHYNFTGSGIFNFVPEEIEITDYVCNDKINYELIG